MIRHPEKCIGGNQKTDKKVKMNKEIEAKRYVVDYIIPQIKIFVPLMDEDSRKDAWKRDMIIVEWAFGTNLKNRWDLVEMIQEAYAEEISKLNN